MAGTTSETSPGGDEVTREAGNEQRLRLLADRLDDVIYLVDLATGAVLYVNPAFESVFGKEPPEHIDMWQECIDPADRWSFREAWSRVREGEAASAEYRIVRPDGTERWIHDKAFPVEGSASRPRRVVGLAEDVTGWKRVERARTLLADTASFLSTSLEPRQILDGLGRLVVPALADWCRIHLTTPSGELEPAAPAHVNPELVQRVRDLDRSHPPGPGAEGGILDVARTGRATLLAATDPESLVGPSGDPAEVELLRELGVRSAIIVPLQSRDRLLGAMTLVCGPSCREFEDDDVELAREIAARAAVALDHAALLEAEHQARLAAERREAASRMLVRVGAMLGSSLDQREGLRRLADLVVPELADLCIVFVLDDEGGLESVATHHDGVSAGLRERIRRVCHPTEDPGGLVLEAVGGNRAVVVEDVEAPDFLERVGGRWTGAGRDAAGLRSLAIVPLAARGRRIGVMVLATTERSERRYGEAERLFLEELALRASVAVDNAHLFREAERARHEAEEANRAKSDFLAVMSHELRTPLNAIVGYGDLLDSEVAGPVTEDQRRHLSRIRASAWHLLELIEEILSLSKIEAGRVELEWEPLDAREIAEEAVTLVRPAAREKDLPIRVDGPEEEVDFTSDRSRVRQVLVNLLSNAVKFTDDGFVILSFEGQDGEVRFHVRDTGPGISRDEQEAIFEPFSQGGRRGGKSEASDSGRQKGTGLGLAVSRRFARLMGGDVTVESEPGEGSVFTVRLPVEPSPES